MVYTSRAEKRRVQALIDDYVKAKQPLSVPQYRRLAAWLGGMTMAEIAQAEGVSPQTVGQSIKRDTKRILEWGELQARRTA